MKFRNQSGVVVMMSMLGAAGAFAQEAKTVMPEFEVAVIKPTQLGQGMPTNLSMGIKVSARQVSIKSLPIQRLIEIAYGVKSYQVEDPSKLLLLVPRDPKNPGIFDIEAKVPEGATAAQVPLMLQALLAARFKLEVHRTSKQMDINAITVGKDGPKFQRKEGSAETDGFSAQNLEVNINMGGGGSQIGGTKFSPGPNGGMRMEISNLNELTEILNSMLGPLPVVDKTGLKGGFNIVMDMAVPDDDSLHAAVNKLGLKLEKQKDQIETIVVDHVERVPSEN